MNTPDIASTRPQHGGPVQLFYQSSQQSRLSVVTRGDGIYLWDHTGRKYIDASSGPIAVNIGHGNKRVAEAARRQMEKVAYASRFFFENEANSQLSDLVTQHAGPGFERAYFVSGGSEATETAMKLARQYAVENGEESRWKILSRNPSYHGASLGAVAVTGDFVSERVFAPMIRPMPKVSAPFSYRVPSGHTAQSYIMACADELEQTIEREGPETVLAFIMEPVGGLATGALVSTPEYCRRVREICDRYGILLIYDEVMSGVGRTGTFLAAHDLGALPDIAILAKGLASGYTPLGAVLAPAKLVDTIAASGGFKHGYTYASNPLSCAIGVAAIQETIERNLDQNAIHMGRRLRSQLEQVQQRRRVLGDIRGKGLLMAIEIVSDPETKAIFPESANAIATIVALARERGLLLYARRTAQGRYGEWLMIAPPLIVTADEVDTIVGLIDDTLEAFEAQL